MYSFVWQKTKYLLLAQVAWVWIHEVTFFIFLRRQSWEPSFFWDYIGPKADSRKTLECVLLKLLTYNIIPEELTLLSFKYRRLLMYMFRPTIRRGIHTSTFTSQGDFASRTILQQVRIYQSCGRSAKLAIFADLPQIFILYGFAICGPNHFRDLRTKNFRKSTFSPYKYSWNALI